MRLEVLVEGQADRTALEPLLSKIVGPFGQPHEWRIHKHRGLGELPGDLCAKPDPRNPTLLHSLPASLSAYGKSLSPADAVVVVVDLDTADCHALKSDLLGIASATSPSPQVLFRIAIEELEAWFLGDRQAVLAAYPHAKVSILDGYAQDDVCGTWEVLADAVYPGGTKALKAKGLWAALEQKRIWARDIAPKMDVDANASPSFRVFRDGLRRLVGSAP